MDESVPRIIDTSRLRLRTPRITDAEAVFEEYASDPEVPRYLPWRAHETVQDTEEFLKSCVQKWEGNENPTWVLTVRDDDRAIGMIDCRLNGHKVDLGYVLARRLWSQGLMTEAVRAVVDWALARESVFRVWALVDFENVASARVLEKAGMQQEGTLRRYLMHPNISREPRDCIVYSKIR